MHRPSRFLAPLALLAALLAVFLIVSATTGDDGDGGSDTTTEERREARQGGSTSATDARTSTTPRRRRYTVKPGDTLAAISQRTGVPVEDILELNPDIDANSLTVGDRIKLTE
jgi:LysM repeat protein